MPTPQRRDSATGDTAWRVRYRLAGRQSGETFYTLGAAQEFCDWIRLFGPARAVQLLHTREAAQTTPAAATAPTLDDWAARYINALPSASGSTKAEYRSSYKHSFGRLLGHVRIDALDREAIAGAITQLQKIGGREGTGYSDKSIANHHGLLSAMLATAAADGLITTSPCVRIRLPRSTDHTTTPKRYLTHDEFHRLWSAAGAHHRPLLETFVSTGIRWGEAEALLVSDVNLDTGQLQVTKAAKKTGQATARMIGPTKTRRSKRFISLDAELVETLERVVGGRGPQERLFVAPRGGQLVHKTFWDGVWAPSCARAELGDPRPRIHDLRHTHASWMIAEGIDMKTLQERLGHESITTTMDLYGHLLPGAQEKAAAASSRAISKALGRARKRPAA